jgi:hypothetical protein
LEKREFNAKLQKRSQIIEEIQGIFKIDGVNKATTSIAGGGLIFVAQASALCVCRDIAKVPG